MGKPKLVCFDGNISAGCIYNILNTCKTYNISSKWLYFIIFIEFVQIINFYISYKHFLKQLLYQNL